MEKFNAEKLWDPATYGITDNESLAKNTMANYELTHPVLPAMIHNLYHNISAMHNLEPVTNLFNSCPGGQFIVAGAGPSLTTNAITTCANAVRDLGAILIAVDAAWQDFKEEGITPHATVTIDPMSSVKGMFSPMYYEEDDKFIVGMLTHPSVIRELTGAKKYAYGIISPFHHLYLLARKLLPESCYGLRSGSVVTLTAIDLAMWMGADKVITIGNELCYRERDEVPEVHAHTIVNDTDINHEIRYTIPAFINARAQLVQTVKWHGDNVQFIDASAGLQRNGWYIADDLDMALEGMFRAEYMPDFEDTELRKVDQEGARHGR